MNNKLTVISTLVAGVLIVGALMFAGPSSLVPDEPVNNVVMEEGTQIVDITAKGGYFPRETIAKAGIPTVLRVLTKGTYDCSAALSVSAAGFRDYLKPSGTTDIELPPQDPGAIVNGVCSMGMYSFAVKFE